MVFKIRLMNKRKRQFPDRDTLTRISHQELRGAEQTNYLAGFNPDLDLVMFSFFYEKD